MHYDQGIIVQDPTSLNQLLFASTISYQVPSVVTFDYFDILDLRQSFLLIGSDQHLIEKILDPTYPHGIAKTFRKFQNTTVLGLLWQ